jgi:very-short-patch-repair endonuclease
MCRSHDHDHKHEIIKIENKKEHKIRHKDEHINNVIVIFECHYNCCKNNVEYCWEVFIKNDKCFDCEHKELCETLPKLKECKNKIGRSKFCEEKCYYCYIRSFASNPKSRYWSKDNDINPRYVSKKSGKKFKFKCDKDICGHKFEITISDNCWCGYCANRRRYDKNINCIPCFNKSFASHPKSVLWHPTKNGDIEPRDIPKRVRGKFWMLCENNICKHSYETIISNYTQCPYCSNSPKLLCNKNIDCNACFNKSFASHPTSELWNYKKNFPIIPREIFLNTYDKYWFICDKKDCNANFYMDPHNINQKNQGCPNCKLKTEKKLFDFLINHYKYKIIRQQKFSWCKNIKELPFDFYIQIFNLIIELDGRQHFVKVKNRDDPDIIQKNDIYKTFLALNKGKSIIRISQDDVWNDRINWKKELIKYIKAYEIPTTIYISNNRDLYNTHKLLLDKEFVKQSLKNKLKSKITNVIIKYL